MDVTIKWFRVVVSNYYSYFRSFEMNIFYVMSAFTSTAVDEEYGGRCHDEQILSAISGQLLKGTAHFSWTWLIF